MRVILALVLVVVCFTVFASAARSKSSQSLTCVAPAYRSGSKCLCPPNFTRVTDMATQKTACSCPAGRKLNASTCCSLTKSACKDTNQCVPNIKVCPSTAVRFEKNGCVSCCPKLRANSLTKPTICCKPDYKWDLIGQTCVWSGY